MCLDGSQFFVTHLGFEHPTFRLRDEHSYPVRQRRGF